MGQDAVFHNFSYFVFPPFRPPAYIEWVPAFLSPPLALPLPLPICTLQSPTCLRSRTLTVPTSLDNTKSVES